MDAGDEVQAAYERVRRYVVRTPSWRSERLSARLGLDVWLKGELFQLTGSFKIRGVLNTLLQLTAAECEAGVIGMSAGNHAAALARGAAIVETHATVVMPRHANPSKIAATRQYGGEVVLTERSLPEVMLELQRERGLTLVHPFDDPRIIAGAAGVGVELAADVSAPDVVLVPVGGGGLISGVARAVRAVWPATQIVGVEPAAAAGMTAALAAGEIVTLDHPRSLADGLAAPFAGRHTLACVQQYVDSVVVVDEDELLTATGMLAREAKLAAEPAGAAGLAALIAGATAPEPGARVALVISVGNAEPAVLAQALQR